MHFTSKQLLTLFVLTTLSQVDFTTSGILERLTNAIPALLNKQPPVTTPNCALFTAQLAALFNLMCNNIGLQESNTVRDACLGCFRQAVIANNNQPSLTDLDTCAESYFPNTRYSECSTGQIDTGLNPTGLCVSGYCRLVRCIRRVNSDLLVRNQNCGANLLNFLQIAQCFDQASLDNDLIFEADQVVFVKNVTSCILAMSRCSSLNPITGQSQSSTLTTTTYDKWGTPTTTTVPLYNSLQITPEGDLRIVQLPGTTKVQSYFCSVLPNLRESSWLEFSC